MMSLKAVHLSASVYLHLSGAGFALDVAAPVILAVASLLHLHHVTGVAPPTAHGATAP